MLSIVIKTAYLLSGDTASIFYTQKRVGLNGRPIRILKYRSMVTDADKKLAELLKDEKYRIEWEQNQKLSDDPLIISDGSHNPEGIAAAVKEKSFSAGMLRIALETETHDEIVASRHGIDFDLSPGERVVFSFAAEHAVTVEAHDAE